MYGAHKRIQQRRLVIMTMIDTARLSIPNRSQQKKKNENRIFMRRNIFQTILCSSGVCCDIGTNVDNIFPIFFFDGNFSSSAFLLMRKERRKIYTNNKLLEVSFSLYSVSSRSVSRRVTRNVRLSDNLENSGITTKSTFDLFLYTAFRWQNRFSMIDLCVRLAI